MKKINKKGFSLVETIIAILVICAVIAIGFIVFTKNKNPSSQQLSTDASEASEPYKYEPEQNEVQRQESEQDLEPRSVETEPEGSEAIPGAIPGEFSQSPESTWPSTQTIAYIGVTTPKDSRVSKVEWYLGDSDPELKYTKSTGYQGLYQFDWPISSLPNGRYHWTARVYDEQGNFQLVKARDGNTYINMYINR